MNTADWWLVAYLGALAIAALMAPRVLAALVGEREKAGEDLVGVFPGVPLVVAILSLFIGWGMHMLDAPGPFGPLLPFAILLLYVPALRLGNRLPAFIALALTPLSIVLYFLYPEALNLLVAVVLILAIGLLLVTDRRPATDVT